MPAHITDAQLALDFYQARDRLRLTHRYRAVRRIVAEQAGVTLARLDRAIAANPIILKPTTVLWWFRKVRESHPDLTKDQAILRVAAIFHVRPNAIKRILPRDKVGRKKRLNWSAVRRAYNALPPGPTRTAHVATQFECTTASVRRILKTTV